MAEHGLTGFVLRPAKVRFRDGLVSEEYRQLVVTGWGGIARPESGIHLLEACAGCLHKTYSGLKDAGRIIDPGQWTGEDLFTVWPLPTYTFITRRVKDFLETNAVRSYYAHTLNEHSPICQYASTECSIGGLAQFIPEEQALRYGRPLGLA
jgi:hypothetical protein